MKLLIISCLVALAAADVSHVLNKSGPTGEATAQIRKLESEVSPDGFKYSYETDNGIAADAEGQLKGTGEDAPLVIQGQNSHTAPTGEKISIQYIADENGYQPQGSHLPTPPPIPEAIQRAIQYIQAHPPKPDN